MKLTKEQLDCRIQLLLHNGLTPRSSMTLADTEVLKEIALRLGYNLEKLKALDNTDPAVNPYLALTKTPRKRNAR